MKKLLLPTIQLNPHPTSRIRTLLATVMLSSFLIGQNYVFLEDLTPGAEVVAAFDTGSAQTLKFDFIGIARLLSGPHYFLNNTAVPIWEATCAINPGPTFTVTGPATALTSPPSSIVHDPMALNGPLLTATWTSVSCGSGVTINVVVQVHLIVGTGDIEWNATTTVQGASAGAHLLHFPQIGVYPITSGGASYDRVTLPLSNGYMLMNPSAHILCPNCPTSLSGMMTSSCPSPGPGEAFDDNWAEFRYPGQCSMQFFSMYNEESKDVLYMAAHDTNLHSKRFGIGRPDNSPTSGDREIRLRVTHCPPYDPSVPYSIPYRVVTSVLRSPTTQCWFDASSRYKNWIVNANPIWLSRGKWKQSADFPSWFKNARLGMGVGPSTVATMGWAGAHGQIAQNLLGWRAASQSTLPYYATWYSWNQDAFNRIAPDYLLGPNNVGGIPTGFSAAMAVVQSDGGRVIPYVLPTAASDDSPTVMANPSAFKAANSVQLLNGAYHSGYFDAPPGECPGSCPSGQCYLLTTSCLATASWQALIGARLNDIATALPIDGLYLDTLGGVLDHRCYNTSHGHTIGGGNHWAQGKRSVFTSIKTAVRTSRPDSVFTTELCEEGLVDLVHEFHGPDVHDIYYLGGYNAIAVPMFNAVYHEYTVMSTFAPPPYDLSANPGGGCVSAVDLQTVAIGNAILATQGQRLYSLNPNADTATFWDTSSQCESDMVQFIKRLEDMQLSSLDYSSYGERLRPLQQGLWPWLIEAATGGAPCTIQQATSLPPVACAPASLITSSIFEYSPFRIDPAPPGMLVLGMHTSTWRGPPDANNPQGKIGVLIANPFESVASEPVVFDPMLYGLNPSQTYHAYPNGGLSPSLQIPGGTPTVSILTMPPRSALWFEIR